MSAAAAPKADWKSLVASLDSAFPALKAELTIWLEGLANSASVAHLAEALQYNVPHGKKTRGATVIFAFSTLAGVGLEEAAESAATAAWAVELLQASFLVHDDIMDSSISRRGQPCWHKRVGLVAINDGIMLMECLYLLMRNRYSLHKQYAPMLNLFHEVTMTTSIGQSMDWQLMLDPKATKQPEMRHYMEMVRHKTASYSFYLPVALAALLADRPQLLPLASRLLLPIGEYFQVQDDFLDCFGDPAELGKVGTDVQEGKCSWLALRCLELTVELPDERAEFWANFGRDSPDCVDRVRQLYRRLRLPEDFRDYANAAYAAIVGDIRAAKLATAAGDGAGDTAAVCDVCQQLLDKIHMRSK